VDFNEIISTPIVDAGNTNKDSLGYSKYYFGTAVPMQDFYLAGDIIAQKPGINSNPDANAYYGCTPGTWDTCLHRILYDTLHAYHINFDDFCMFYDMSYINKDGEWRSLEDDSVYYIYRYQFVKIVPIIMVVKNTDSNGVIEEVGLDKSCYVYPNPTKEILNITSAYKIKQIEIYNDIGIKVKEQTLYQQQATINIKTLPSGNYIAKLQTTQGLVTKKFVIKRLN